MIPNLDEKLFKVKANSETGEVSGDTLFYYHQLDDVIWAEYKGGSIVKGFLIGKVVDNERLEFTYQHVNTDKEQMTGICTSYPKQLPTGEISIHEEWQWTCKDKSSGTSELIELNNPV